MHSCRCQHQPPHCGSAPRLSLRLSAADAAAAVVAVPGFVVHLLKKISIHSVPSRWMMDVRRFRCAMRFWFLRRSAELKVKKHVERNIFIDHSVWWNTDIQKKTTITISTPLFILMAKQALKFIMIWWCASRHFSQSNICLFCCRVLYSLRLVIIHF